MTGEATDRLPSKTAPGVQAEGSRNKEQARSWDWLMLRRVPARSPGMFLWIHSSGLHGMAAGFLPCLRISLDTAYCTMHHHNPYCPSTGISAPSPWNLSGSSSRGTPILDLSWGLRVNSGHCRTRIFPWKKISKYSGQDWRPRQGSYMKEDTNCSGYTYPQYLCGPGLSWSVNTPNLRGWRWKIRMGSTCKILGQMLNLALVVTDRFYIFWGFSG